MKDESMRYRSKRDCEVCALKSRCCPHAPVRKISISIYECARDLAREITKTEPCQISRRQRKKVEMLFAHLKRILMGSTALIWQRQEPIYFQGERGVSLDFCPFF